MATRQDLVIDQGSRYLLVCTYTGPSSTNPPDLTGYGLRMQVRVHKADVGAPSGSTVLPADLTSFLSLDVPNKQFTLDIDGATTSAFTWERGYYDIEAFKASSPGPYRMLQGLVIVDKEVTK